jgi:hypothetical protein
MRATHDPVTLQKILGHSDLSMIASTYAHPSPNDLYSGLLGQEFRDLAGVSTGVGGWGIDLRLMLDGAPSVDL